MVSIKKYVRKSVVAGSWYPGSADALLQQLEAFFAKTEKQESGEVKALIAPHAGYAYSGEVAANAFRQLEGGIYKTVIILAPSHQYPLKGVSVSNHTHYATPLGEVKVSCVAEKIRKSSSLVSNVSEAHLKEHAAEIEIPFLQYMLTDFEVVPLLVGELSRSDIDEFSDLIIQHMDESTLLVASTDLSHFHPYNEAVSLDNQCIDSILSLNIEQAAGCEMCGYFPVLVTMKIAQKLNWFNRLLKYMNSGDVIGDTGDTSGVVGYAAFAFYEANKREALSSDQGRYLLKLARDAIKLYVREGKRLEPQTNDPMLKENKGVFVTLEKNGQLRGCIGHLEGMQPLYIDVRDNAINAAFHDPRFKPVDVSELADIEIEVSVLTVPELVVADSPEAYLEKIRPGSDGIILECGGRSATYLPQVWETLPGKEEFLSSLCMKAGLSGDCWREPEARIYKYQVVAFKEGDFR